MPPDQEIAVQAGHASVSDVVGVKEQSVLKGLVTSQPFWVTVAVISRDVFILVGAAAINIVTGFRRFRPSMLGKINTTVQIVAIGLIIFAASVPYGTGYYLPTIYTTVFAFAVLSGAHYVFFVS